MVSEKLVEKFCDAVEVAEGYGEPGAIPTRANNPGDLTDDGDIGFGTIRSAGRAGANITVYSSYVQGRGRLEWKVRRMLSGASDVYLLSMSIKEVGIKWAEVFEWGVNVANQLGVDPETTLAQLAASDLTDQARSDG